MLCAILGPRRMQVPCLVSPLATTSELPRSHQQSEGRAVKGLGCDASSARCIELPRHARIQLFRVGTLSVPGRDYARLGNGALWGGGAFSRLPEQAWSDDEGEFFPHLLRQRDIARSTIIPH